MNIHWHADRPARAENQTDKQTTDRQTGRQIDRPTNRHKLREQWCKCIYIYIYIYTENRPAHKLMCGGFQGKFREQNAPDSATLCTPPHRMPTKHKERYNSQAPNFIIVKIQADWYVYKHVDWRKGKQFDRYRHRYITGFDIAIWTDRQIGNQTNS
jgi:hypothetical protein